MIATLEQIKAPVEGLLADFRATWQESLSTDNALLQHMITHVNQSVGKQMRPVLTLLSACIAGGATPATMHAAVALELLHVASLIHDDVVDDSPTRRGKPSVAAAFNNPAAVLGGDYFLATSLQQASLTGHLFCVQAISQLGRNLSEGELLQMETVERAAFDESVYFQVITNKTAVLFSTCALLGASTGLQVHDSLTQQLEHIGRLIGLIFQLCDDLLDYRSEEEVGKPTGHDLAEHKATLPLIYVYQTGDEARQQRILSALEDGEIAFLQQLVRDNGGLTYTEQRIDALALECQQCIDALPASPYRDALMGFAQFAGRRHA